MTGAPPGTGRPAPDRTVDVQVLLGGDRDTDDWARRHAAGEVPDAFPYGLDHLAAHGLPVRPAYLRAHPPRLLRGGLRRAVGGLDWLHGALVRTDADVVLAWDERVGVPHALLQRDRPPTVANVIWATDAVPARPLREALSTGLRRMHRVFVLSSGQVPVLTSAYRVDPRRVDVVPFGVADDFFTPGPPSEVDPDLVVSVGNDRDRDFETVLRAFRAVRASRPTARLVIVSLAVTGTDVAGVDGVSLVPLLDHAALRALLRRAALTLTLTRPNLHASGITAVLESTAVGRPAITTANPGMADYAPAGGGVLLVPPGDVDAAAAACLALLADLDAASAAGAAGRVHLEERFSTARQADRIAPLLRDAAAAG